jgi:hypothetical protein
LHTKQDGERFKVVLLKSLGKEIHMSNPQILYETKLARPGRTMILGGVMIFALWTGAGLVLCFRYTPFPKRLFALAFLGIGAAVPGWLIYRGFQLIHNAGFYRIHLDDYGLYVQCDAPSFPPSFSIIAPNLKCLVRRTIKSSEGPDDHEYYVETRSGKRHRIEELLLVTDYEKINVMQIFDKITDRFTWVEIIEEVA